MKTNRHMRGKRFIHAMGVKVGCSGVQHSGKKAVESNKRQNGNVENPANSDFKFLKTLLLSLCAESCESSLSSRVSTSPAESRPQMLLTCLTFC